MSFDNLWDSLYTAAEDAAQQEPVLKKWLAHSILDRQDIGTALAHHLAHGLDNGNLCSPLAPLFSDLLKENTTIVDVMCRDLIAVYRRDSACIHPLRAFLFFKGFNALQVYRLAHQLWKNGRHTLALFLQSRTSEVYGVDIHPAAVIGAEIMLDHANGIVIGETCHISDQVSIMQEVTLGGTGKEKGDRHPKIGRGALISAGAKILGNIIVGAEAKIAAGSVVLSDVPPRCTVAGIPAQIIRRHVKGVPALEMNHDIN